MHKFLFYNKFIIFLYMFRTMCSSSGGQNCIIQHLVSSHSVGGRPVHRCTRRPPTEVHGTATYRMWWYQMLYNTILTSWWWAQQCSKRVEKYNKLIIKQEFAILKFFLRDKNVKFRSVTDYLMKQWLVTGYVNCYPVMLHMYYSSLLRLWKPTCVFSNLSS